MHGWWRACKRKRKESTDCCDAAFHQTLIRKKAATVKIGSLDILIRVILTFQSRKNSRQESSSTVTERSNSGVDFSQNVDEVKLDTNEAEYETVITPIIIATPPRYGTGSL